MREQEREKLLGDISELRGLIARHTTEAIVGFCHLYWLTLEHPDEGSKVLGSPAKQWTYLLGLMLASPEHDGPLEFSRTERDRVIDLLESIFTSYLHAYFAEPSEAVSDKWKRVREVAMPAFLQYMMQGLLASTDQVQHRIARYLSPFDELLKTSLDLVRHGPSRSAVG